ncbi:MAG: nucleotidyltransferase domain-containing protein [Chitinivibrionales bacterium]|nr:nucleotidyltransferase domain-containing protein [Chitinivibrionales bacterium]
MLKDAKYLTENEHNALDEIKKRISARYPVKQFILFGSKARGDFRSDSDIDLLIEITNSLTWRENDDIIGEVYEVNLAYGTLFTAHTVVEQEWKSGLWTCLSLKQNVEKEGVLV